MSRFTHTGGGRERVIAIGASIGAWMAPTRPALPAVPVVCTPLDDAQRAVLRLRPSRAARTSSG